METDRLPFFIDYLLQTLYNGNTRRDDEMKTKIKVIAPEEEERAELFVHKEDREIKSLGRYLELE